MAVNQSTEKNTLTIEFLSIQTRHYAISIKVNETHEAKADCRANLKLTQNKTKKQNLCFI